MRVLLGQMVFVNKQKRDQAQTKATTEVNARGLVPYTWDFGQGIGPVTGLLAVGTTTLCASYSADDATIMQAEDDLYRWMDSNGFVDGWLGSVLIPT